MNIKYYIGILCAVTLVIGAMAGLSVSAADDADVNEITKTMDTETVIGHMEAKGFDVTAQGDQISAYKEEFGKTIQITMDCPDGECQFQKPQSPEGMNKCGMNKKHFKFRMHGAVDMEAIKAKMEEMGYNMEDIGAKMAGMEQKEPGNCPMKMTDMPFMAGMEHKGFEGCPMRAMMEQEVVE